jgi:ribonuclease Z
MKLTILGCNAASPAYGRHPTAQILEIDGELFLIDCGEGTQMRMQDFNIKSARINNVFISHMHGDHYFGLIGWLNSQSLFGRTRKLHIYCPEKLKAIVEIQLDYKLSYEIVYTFLQEAEETKIYDGEKITVSSFAVKHSIPTWGFKFLKKNRKRVLIPEKIRALEIPKYYYSKLCDGINYTFADGREINYEEVTAPGKPNLTYVYSADTIFDEALAKIAANANCLYHEATYLDAQLDKATARFHSTARQAATIAKLANTKLLIIGHYSSKYINADAHLEEAKCIFANVKCAVEGESYCID